MHPYHVEGGVASCSARIILRDFETSQLTEYARWLEKIAQPLRRLFPQATIAIDIRTQYRNIRDGMSKEPRAVPLAIEAIEAAGLIPRRELIRGGTDGSRLTEMGLPTPNLSAGQHNPHSPLEWTSVEEMQKGVDVLIELARRWSRETGLSEPPVWATLTLHSQRLFRP